MCLYAHVRVCMCTCMRMCVTPSVSMCTCVSVVCMCTCVSACVRACVCVCLSASLHAIPAHRRARAHISTKTCLTCARTHTQLQNHVQALFADASKDNALFKSDLLQVLKKIEWHQPFRKMQPPPAPDVSPLPLRTSMPCSIRLQSCPCIRSSFTDTSSCTYITSAHPHSDSLPRSLPPSVFSPPLTHTQAPVATQGQQAKIAPTARPKLSAAPPGDLRKTA